MKKILKVKGMSCEHCQKRVENALNQLPGLEAKVNLKKEEVTLNVQGDWNEQQIRAAISEAGYDLISIKDKKGLFGR